VSTIRTGWAALAGESGSLNLNGLRLRYQHTTPTPEKPWLALALPFGIPIEIAAAAFDALRPAFNVITWENRYVLAPDVPFDGDEALTPDDHVDDLVAVMAALGIDRCRLIGYCSGAGFALVAATRHPDRFSELVLVCGELQLFRRGHAATAYQRSIDGFLPVVAQSRETAAAIFTTMAEVSSAAARDDDSPLQRQMNFPFTDQERLFRYARSYLGYRDFDAFAYAGDVSQPTLVIAGRRDEHTDPENAQAVAEVIPGAALLVDDEADHYAFCASNSALLDAVVQHLGR